MVPIYFEYPRAKELVDEFKALFSYNLREFIYIYTINGKQSQPTVQWIDENRYSQVEPLVYKSQLYFLEVLSEKFREGMTPVFYTTSEAQIKDSTGYQSAKSFLQNGFLTSVVYSKTKDMAEAKPYYRWRDQIADPSQGESIVHTLVKRVTKMQGLNFSYKLRQLKKIHLFFLQAEEDLPNLLSQVFATQRSEEVTNFLSISPLIQDLTTYISHRIVPELPEDDMSYVNQIVEYTSRYLSIRIVEFIIQAYTLLVQRLCGYLLVSPACLILCPGSPKVPIDRDLLLCLDPRSLDRVLNRLQALSPHKDYSVIIKESLKLHKAEAIASDFERDKLLLKTSIKRAAWYMFKEPIPTQLRMPPVLKVKFVETPQTKGRDVQETREERLYERKICRHFIMNVKGTIEEEVDQRVFIYFDKGGGDKHSEGDRDEIFSNRKLFGWLSCEKFLLRPDVSFKKLFAFFVRLMFCSLTSVETIDFSSLKAFSSKADKEKLGTYIYPVTFPEALITDLFSVCLNVFKHSLIGLCGILITLDHFNFLFLQQNTIVKDIFASEIICEDDVAELELLVKGEITALLKDQEFLSLQVPEEINTGIFNASLSSFKKQCLQQVKETLKALRRSSVSELKKYLDIIASCIEEVTSTCKGVPDSVEGYIKLKKKLNAAEFAIKIQTAKATSQAFDVLIKALEILREPYDMVPLGRKLQMNAEFRAALETHDVFLEQFESSKVNYYNDILQLKSDIKLEFDAL